MCNLRLTCCLVHLLWCAEFSAGLSCQTALNCCAMIIHHFVKSIKWQGFALKPPGSRMLSTNLVRAAHVHRGNNRLPGTFDLCLVTRKAIVRRCNRHPLKHAPLPPENTENNLPVLSQVPKASSVWHVYNRVIFALSTLYNGYLILVDRFTFESYIQLETGGL